MSSKQNSPKTKLCDQCQEATSVAFRVRLSKNKDWVFVCKLCCEKASALPDYQYGGTWKGQKK